MGTIRLSLDEFTFLHGKILKRFTKEQSNINVARLTQKQRYGYDDYNKDLPNIRASMIALGVEKGLFGTYAYDTFNGKYLYNGWSDMKRHTREKELNETISIGAHGSVSATLLLLYAGYETLEHFYEDFAVQNNPLVLEFEGYAYFNMFAKSQGKVYTYTLTLTQKQMAIDVIYTAELRFIYDGQRVNTYSIGTARYSDDYLFVQLDTQEINTYQYFLTLFPNGNMQKTVFMRGMLQLVSKDSQIVSTQIFFLSKKSAELNPALVEQVQQQILQQGQEIRMEVKRIYKIEHFLNEGL